jgi:hypothetical protein
MPRTRKIVLSLMQDMVAGWGIKMYEIMSFRPREMLINQD